MSFESTSTAIRRFIPLPIILFNLILALVGIVDLASGLVVDSYVAASYLLCITSLLSALSLTLITILNLRRSGWMPYELGFELSWVVLVLLLQLIAAAVISSDPSVAHCRTGEHATYGGYNICPTHQATEAFSWAAFLLLFTHLFLLAVELFLLAHASRMTPLGVLLTPTADLPLSPSRQYRVDTEKGLARAPSPGSSGSYESGSTFSPNGRAKKHRPPPLNLSDVSVTGLPIYATYAKKEAAERRAFDQQRPWAQPEPQRTQPQHTRVQPHLIQVQPLQPQRAPNRHEIMAQIIRENPDLPTPSTYTHHSFDTTATIPGHQLVHQPSVPESISNWNAPDAWRVEESRRMPTQPPAALMFSIEKRHEGVVNRPDPRDRRPAHSGELAAEGGFWITRHVNKSYLDRSLA